MHASRGRFSLQSAQFLCKRFYSTPKSEVKHPLTYARILDRTPGFLRPTVTALHNAPVAHITAFLLLHELTAIVPLLGLAGAFHYYHWLPSYFAEGAWVVSGVEKFGKYFKRKGWIGAGEEAVVEKRAHDGKGLMQAETTKGLKWWNSGDGGLRWVVEFATAYAVVKALLPLRIVVSVWSAPWFARWTVIPCSNAFKRLFAKSSTTGRTSPGTGTTAVVAKKPSRP